MKVLVCGSRTWQEAEPIFDRLSTLKAETFARGEKITLLHGNDPGVDRLARNLGFGLRFTVEHYPIDWQTDDYAVTLRRDDAMMDRDPDLVIVFQNDNSRSVSHILDLAHRRNIPVELHVPNPEDDHAQR